MNLDALEQVRVSWSELQALMSAAAAWEAPTVLGGWRATSTCLALAATAPEPVPRVWSALWKTTLGYHQALLLLVLEHDLGAAPLSSLGTGPQFAAWCARERLLFGQAEVCAGSPAWIARGFEVLCARTPGPLPLSRVDAETFLMATVDDLRARQAAHLAGSPRPPGPMSWHVDGRPFSLADLDRLQSA